MFTREDVFAMVDALFHEFSSSNRIAAKESCIKMMDCRESQKPPNEAIPTDALCGECIKIGRNGEHSWRCRKCGEDLR